MYLDKKQKFSLLSVSLQFNLDGSYTIIYRFWLLW